ncbi:pyridoxamine 5'-phosphate oxidase [Pontibacter akesuensis]|uniref:Pyridoxine/pyridoxamine 5'-phosphate oxidase n=1 Tax=Pontibacter akesuensis TaxID=388950 RepID=A0A1I7G446_9BACT|nr:pyridoxamine 5'-phosphate oxidase [Pontibacter akesuensis]GHA58982.1 pyridoxine/pyridoxamine 5'-phosphate oxidase [Pontibacter akesuensis]SFU43111.1 Pyridoxamine 5'-phosphate oxidase [Pontibacter akesuensis]
MASSQNIADIRNNYSQQALNEDSVAENPVQQFKVWLDEAITSEAPEPTALVLSTVSAAGKPSARVVLLKGVDDAGFTFFTNYNSRKGQELEAFPYAAITFFWPSLERQVRVEGKVVKVAPEVSDEYFHSRPQGSQIGAWASPQSQVIQTREELEELDEKYKQQFSEVDVIPRPSHWGGFQLQPEAVEFWQGRPNRLHDRILYEQEDGKWQLKRLAP